MKKKLIDVVQLLTSLVLIFLFVIDKVIYNINEMFLALIVLLIAFVIIHFINNWNDYK